MPTPSTQCQRRSKLKQGRSRRWLRGVCAAACLLLAGVFFFRALPPGSISPSADGPSVQTVGLAGAERPQWVTSNIEDIRVGDRVVGRNPELTDAERTTPEPDPATWRRLELRAPKVDGTWADVVLLRSLSWLQEQQAEVGGQVWISVPECGIDGHATVLAIGPCPPIPPGPGRVVTGTYRHASAQVLDLHVDGLAEPIGTTANHPFWSVDREAFVRADSLAIGEHLRALDGIDRVLAVSRRARPERVYNLEVHMEHVYHVGHSGVLVHNGGLLPCPKGPARLSPGQLGRQGESLASEISGAGKNTQSFVVNGRTRIPDQVLAQDIATRQPTIIGEVKNVQRQALTRQLRDDIDLVGPGGRADVYLPPGARVTRPLQRAFDDPLNPLNRVPLVRPQ